MTKTGIDGIVFIFTPRRDLINALGLYYYVQPLVFEESMLRKTLIFETLKTVSEAAVT